MAFGVRNQVRKNDAAFFLQGAAGKFYPDIVYLKLRRLNLCRIRLARADPEADTVKDVVARTGFRDSGRFAAEYRTYFGEFPSETLHRRTRPNPQAFRLEL